MNIKVNWRLFLLYVLIVVLINGALDIFFDISWFAEFAVGFFASIIMCMISPVIEEADKS